MSQAINLKDTGSEFRSLVQSIQSTNEEYEVKDDAGQTVAVVLPMERYRFYQREWEADFAAVDRFRDRMKLNDPASVEAQIEKAIAEIKTKARTGGDT